MSKTCRENRLRHGGALNRLSRMRGNHHVRFLGEERVGNTLSLPDKTPATETTDTAIPASYESESSAVREINRLHAEARRLERDSRQALDAALAAAWQAGRLLIAEKARIRRHGGRGAWLPWLKNCFQGGARTAQRYMQLARRMDDPASLRGLSLRQACLRLGIPISPRDAREAAPVQKLPAHTCTRRCESTG